MRFRNAVVALAVGLERLLRDPGSRPIALQTGKVVITSKAMQTDRVESLRAVIEGQLAPPRFVAAADGVHAPSSRRRAVSAFVEERWTAVPAALDDAGIAQVATTGQIPLAGWRVTQHVTLKRSLADMNEVERQELLQSIGQFHRHEDFIYNGYYPTIKGNDVAHHDPSKQGMEAFQGGSVIRGHATKTHDGVIRGGTEIRGGRREWREKTKNYVVFGPGYFAHVARIRADQQAERDRKHRIAYEKADALLPRKIGEL